MFGYFFLLFFLFLIFGLPALLSILSMSYKTNVAASPTVVPWGLLIFIVIIILAVIFFLTYLYQRWYFATYFYDLTSDFVQIKKGPITPREITIPYERIQDVYVDQDLLDRIFGLYDVHISSATSASGTQAHIDGVEKQAADGLREALLETVKQRIGKNRFSNNVQTNS